VIHPHGFFKHLLKPLLRHGRSKDNGDICERSDALPDGLLKNGQSFVVLLHQVPLVHQNHHSLAVALYQLKDAHILRLNATGSINHQQTNIRIFNGPDGPHHRVELQVFGHLTLLAQTCGINKIEVVLKTVIAGIVGIAGSAGHRGDNISFFPQQGIHQRGFPGIGPSDNRKTGNIRLLFLSGIARQGRHHSIQQVPGTGAADGGDHKQIPETKCVKDMRIVLSLSVIHLIDH